MLEWLKPTCKMKICVDVLPKEPEECLFCYKTTDYKDAKPQCHLKRGATCRLVNNNSCMFLKRAVSEIDLLFT